MCSSWKLESSSTTRASGVSSSSRSISGCPMLPPTKVGQPAQLLELGRELLGRLEVRDRDQRPRPGQEAGQRQVRARQSEQRRALAAQVVAAHSPASSRPTTAQTAANSQKRKTIVTSGT